MHVDGFRWILTYQIEMKRFFQLWNNEPEATITSITEHNVHVDMGSEAGVRSYLPEVSPATLGASGSASEGDESAGAVGFLPHHCFGGFVTAVRPLTDRSLSASEACLLW